MPEDICNLITEYISVPSTRELTGLLWCIYDQNPRLSLEISFDNHINYVLCSNTTEDCHIRQMISNDAMLYLKLSNCGSNKFILNFGLMNKSFCKGKRLGTDKRGKSIGWTLHGPSLESNYWFKNSKTETIKIIQQQQPIFGQNNGFMIFQFERKQRKISIFCEDLGNDQNEVCVDIPQEFSLQNELIFGVHLTASSCCCIALGLVY